MEPVTSPPPNPRPREEQPASAVDPTSRPVMAAIFSARPATRLLISPLVTQYSMDLIVGILGKDEFKLVAICADSAGQDSDVIRVKAVAGASGKPPPTGFAGPPSPMGGMGSTQAE